MSRLLGPIYVIALTAALTACDPTPDGVISPEPMAQIMADMEMGEAVVETDGASFRNDSLRQLLRQSICARHDVTTADVDSSLTWYGMHVEQYTKVYARVEEILEQRLRKARESGANESNLAMNTSVASLDGDSVDVWQDDRTWRIAANSPSRIISFSLGRDQYFEPGDIYELRFKTLGSAAEIDVNLSADYSGLTDYAVTRFSGNGWHSITLGLTPDKAANRIYGSLNVGLKGSMLPAYVDSLQLIRMRHRHARNIKSPISKHSIKR